MGVEASSLSEDEGVRLAPSMKTLDDEVPAAAHGPGLPRGGLVAPVVHLPPSQGGMASGRRWASAASWRLQRRRFGGLLAADIPLRS